MIAKMNKTEIPAKILKRKKFKGFIIGITPKNNQDMCRVSLSFKPDTKQIRETVQALEKDIGFWRPSWLLFKKLKNAKKNYQANSEGPVCILQIF